MALQLAGGSPHTGRGIGCQHDFRDRFALDDERDFGSAEDGGRA